MPDYIVLMTLTEQGARDIDNAPAIIQVAKDLWTNLGGTFTSFHVTFGEHDYVAVGQAPNDWAVAAFVAAMAASGNVTTTTMKALTEDDWHWVLSAPADALRDGDRNRIVQPRFGKKGFGNFPVTPVG